MSAAAAGAATAVIAAIEEDFKKYLIVCENLKLDPCVVHEESVIESRGEQLLESAKDLDEKALKKLTKRVEWFKKYYKKLVGKSYGFTKRCTKLVKKNYLKIHPETVSDEFSFEGVTRKNYDFYNEAQKKLGYKALAVVISGLIIITIIVVTIIALI